MKQLYQYQKEAIKVANNHDRFLLALDMGLGKTFTALNWLKTQKQRTTYIICDSAKIDDWSNEAQNLGFSVITLKSLNKKSFNIDIQSKMQKAEQVIICSYGIFRNLINGKGWELWYDINLIIDESQVLKNPKSQLSKCIWQWNRKYAKVLMLSGDPISNGYVNLFMQMKLLELLPEKYSYDAFVSKFCKYYIIPGRRFKIITGYDQNKVNELLALLYHRSFFLSSDQAIELPDQRQHIKQVTTTQHYKTLFKEHALITGEHSITADSSIKLLHAARQLASGCFKADDGSFVNVSDAKLQQLEVLINESTYNFSIFYNYKAEANDIINLIKDKHPGIKIFEINGNANQLPQALQYSDGRFIVLIHYQSGARGIDGLQHKVFNQIYYSLPTSGELFKQSHKRIHRIGQVHKVNYYYFIDFQSIEGQIWNRLQKSQDYTLSMFENWIALNN
ncbi:helicase-like protein [Mycoplasmopsis mustelae]|uniref:Helicase-like protein n=1 Tax=Mycoplasmopsis mustelae TaxID=171289 RepID=A0A4R7UC81_9BACT|nr:SNF2-related protein [Mycoplasmopsis mustelae]TDV23526.1 helicase-like protein [Mycoplasmopsis mustelae]